MSCRYTPRACEGAGNKQLSGFAEVPRRAIDHPINPAVMEAARRRARSSASHVWQRRAIYVYVRDGTTVCGLCIRLMRRSFDSHQQALYCVARGASPWHEMRCRNSLRPRPLSSPEQFIGRGGLWGALSGDASGRFQREIRGASSFDSK